MAEQDDSGPVRLSEAEMPVSTVGAVIDYADRKYAPLSLPSTPYTRVDPTGAIVWQSVFRDSLDTQGLQWGFYDDVIVRHGHAGAVYRKRVTALAALPLRVQPPAHLASHPAAQARAQRTQDTLFSIRNITRSITLLIETWLLKGFAPHQLVPQPRRGQLRVGLAELLWLDPSMVFFTLDGHLHWRDSVGVYRGRDLSAERPGQFVAPAYRGTPMNPYGIGLGEDTLRPFWLSTMGALRAWAAGSERLGIPIRDVSAPKEIINSAPKLDQLKADVRSLNRDAVFVHDEGIKFVLAQANAAGMGDNFDKFVRYCDEIVSKIWLGETLTTDSALKGSTEVATGHREVRQELRDADANALAEWLTESVVGFLEQINEGVDDPADWSQVVLGDPAGAPRGADLAAQVQLLQAARAAQVPMTYEGWYALGVPAPREGETPMPLAAVAPPALPGLGDAPQTPPVGAAFSAPTVGHNRRALEDAAVRPLVGAYRGLLDDLTRDLAGKA